MRHDSWVGRFGSEVVEELFVIFDIEEIFGKKVYRLSKVQLGVIRRRTRNPETRQRGGTHTHL